MGLLEGLVNAEVAEKIQNTPLIEAVKEDKCGWKFERNGLYSVKSAYRFCLSANPNREQLGISGRWNFIWRIQVPPKIKNLLWRVCRNCLPTRVANVNRSMAENAFTLLQVLSTYQQATFACMLWSIWKQRNDAIWRNDVTTRTAVCERAIALLNGWRNA
ncbi:pentatricopeptide repeat-containing protein, partial [Trifolium medium]|nr:pentatricopeptide repeat-containing protein [Trifolium medium]